MSQPDLPPPTSIGPFAEYLRAVIASAALVREMERAHVLAELDAEARADAARGLAVCAHTGYRVTRATERPTEEETAAFLAWEREALGVDRVAGTVVDPRALPGHRP